MNKVAFIGALLRAPVGPGMANRFMTNEAFKASRGTGMVGAAKRVASEVGTALTPTRSSGMLENIGAGLQGLQAVGKAKEYNQMLRPKLASEVLRGHLKKAALPAGIRDTMANALIVGAGLAAAGAGVGAAAKGVGSMYTRLQASRMFSELQRRHPEVKTNPKARQYFDLIVAYAPSLMRHPNAIGDFLMRQLQYPMSSVEFIKQLADLEATVGKTGRESAGHGFGQSTADFAGKATVDYLKPKKG